MTRHLTLPLGAMALLLSAAALAAPLEYLFKSERVCDADKTFCIYGSLTYRFNPRVLNLSARIKTAPGPGLLRITVVGENRLGHRRRAPIEIRVRGKYSEIIDHKMIPDHPDVHDWQVERFEFFADED